MFPAAAADKPETLEQMLLREPDEAVRVLAWRLESLRAAGLEDPAAATVLAHSKSDLHQMCDAIRAGCSARDAVLIFA